MPWQLVMVKISKFPYQNATQRLWLKKNMIEPQEIKMKPILGSFLSRYFSLESEERNPTHYNYFFSFSCNVISFDEGKIAGTK